MTNNINVNVIYPHPHNPRKNLGDINELAESIKVVGILQNLTVVAKGPDGAYTVIIGHRRLAAAKLAGLTEVPCFIAEMDEKTQIATMLLENIQRCDLTVYEQAEGFQMMLDLGDTIDNISDRTGFSQTTVRRRVKLLELDKNKLEASLLRGGTLQEFAELDKIKDTKRKDNVLEYIGTREFQWRLNSAMDEEALPERKKELIKMLSGWAKPTKSTDKLSYVKGFYNFKIDDYKIPEDSTTAEYFYTTDKTSATLYKKEPKAAKKTKSAAEKQFDKHEAALKELTKRAFDMRYEFVRNFRAVKTNIKAIQAYAVKEMLNYGSAEAEKLLSLLGVEIPPLTDGESYSEKRKRLEEIISEHIAISSETVLFLAAYCNTGDSKSSGYYCAQSWCNFKIAYSQNDRLDSLYDTLLSLGYEMSEEEQALREGTHELLKRSEES